KLSRMGVTILPPMPAFYSLPKSVDDIVNHTVMRVLDQFNISTDLARRWDGKVHSRKRRDQIAATKGDQT
ncbi:MAG: hypothetical protein OEN22_08645, partial [Gammaproteobacteria bacterium]|nr:hypothetical protein [Gammaproteobacteria bacterium]